MPDGVDATGLNKLQNAMEQLTGPGLVKFKGRATYHVALAIKGVIAAYPGPAHRPVIWPSEAARKAYFAQRREGGLPMKYMRGSDPMSQRMQQSWTVSRSRAEATLGSRATYAPYVASDEYQTEQHKATGFTTDKQAAETVIADGTVDRIITAQIGAIVKEAFRGL
jgi:hypothetical protein